MRSKNKIFSKKYNNENFKNLEITRFLDDWAYQANVRQKLTSPDKYKIISEMKPFEKKLEQILNTTINVNYSYPWERLFEVEIEFN